MPSLEVRCPGCSRLWPSDRYQWAMPGPFFSTVHVLESRTVTFCSLSCSRPLWCPAVFDLELYDLGLYPGIQCVPCAKVVDAEIGMKWYRKVFVVGN